MNKLKQVFRLALLFSLVSCAHSQPAPPPTQPTMQLYRAAGLGNLDELAKANDFQINGSNQLGTTLLMVAARRNRENSVAYLLSRGASANAKDVHNQTVLHYSLPSQNPRIDELLLRAGGDPSVTDKFGVVPVLAWAEDGRFDSILLALEKRDQWCCYAEMKNELHKILNAELKEKTYIPPSFFIVLKELE